jgi:hypothetical protein
LTKSMFYGQKMLFKDEKVRNDIPASAPFGGDSYWPSTTTFNRRKNC